MPGSKSNCPKTKEKEPGGSCIAFFSLASEVTCPCFCPIQLATSKALKPAQISEEGNLTVCLDGDKNVQMHLKPRHKFPFADLSIAKIKVIANSFGALKQDRW